MVGTLFKNITNPRAVIILSHGRLKLNEFLYSIIISNQIITQQNIVQATARHCGFESKVITQECILGR